MEELINVYWLQSLKWINHSCMQRVRHLGGYGAQLMHCSHYIIVPYVLLL